MLCSVEPEHEPSRKQGLKFSFDLTLPAISCSRHDVVSSATVAVAIVGLVTAVSAVSPCVWVQARAQTASPGYKQAERLPRDFGKYVIMRGTTADLLWCWIERTLPMMSKPYGFVQRARIHLTPSTNRSANHFGTNARSNWPVRERDYVGYNSWVAQRRHSNPRSPRIAYAILRRAATWFGLVTSISRAK